MANDGDNVSALLVSLENERRLIAAGKVQCWEIAKWAVTLNIALAGAALAAFKLSHAALVCLSLAGLALLASAISHSVLMHTSDGRMRGARRAAWLIENHLESKHSLDLRGIANQSKAEPSDDYDRRVLGPYRLAILVSAMPSLVIGAWALYRACPNVFG